MVCRGEKRNNEELTLSTLVFILSKKVFWLVEIQVVWIYVFLHSLPTLTSLHLLSTIPVLGLYCIRKKTMSSQLLMNIKFLPLLLFIYLNLHHSMDISTNEEYTKNYLNLMNMQTKYFYAFSKSEHSKLSLKMDNSNIKVFYENKWKGLREHLFKYKYKR